MDIHEQKHKAEEQQQTHETKSKQRRTKKYSPEPTPHTLYKNKLKMGHGLKCKTQKYKTVRKDNEEKYQDLGLII